MTTSDDFKLQKNRYRRLGPRKYLCTDCGSIFSLSASLVRHQSIDCTRDLVTESKKNHKNTCKNVFKLKILKINLLKNEFLQVKK